jgi:hypothetical protein
VIKLSFPAVFLRRSDQQKRDDQAQQPSAVKDNKA